MLLDAKIFHVAAAEHDVLVDLIRRRDLFFGPASTTLRSERSDIFKRNCGFVRIDLVECAYVAVESVRISIDLGAGADSDNVPDIALGDERDARPAANRVKLAQLCVGGIVVRTQETLTSGS